MPLRPGACWRWRRSMTAGLAPRPPGSAVSGCKRCGTGYWLSTPRLGRGVLPGKIERYKIQERYATRGGHSESVNNCSGARVAVTHVASKTNYSIEIRAYDDGIAFRYIVPGSGSRVPDEATTFTLPAGSTIWFHDFEGHYEGIHQQKEIAAVKDGEWAAPPLTVKLPNG